VCLFLDERDGLGAGFLAGQFHRSLRTSRCRERCEVITVDAMTTENPEVPTNTQLIDSITIGMRVAADGVARASAVRNSEASRWRMNLPVR
jgi:hypothetical protein